MIIDKFTPANYQEVECELEQIKSIRDTIMYGMTFLKLH
jgi:hypothetical protein